MTSLRRLWRACRLARPDRGLAVLTAAMAVGVLACTASILRHQESLLVTARYNAIFDINQTVTASLRVQLALAEFTAEPGEDTRDQVGLRLSILNNQVGVLEHGEARLLTAVASAWTDSVGALQAETAILEDELASLTVPGARVRLDGLARSNLPLMRMQSFANVENGDRARREQARFEASIQTLCAILGVLLLIGLLHALVLLRRSAGLARLADRDPLTGLSNRRAFAERLARAEGSVAAGDRAVLLLDLDMFKAINDTMGHAAGDALLVALGRRLEALAGEGLLVARLGGDEFAVLLEGADIDGRCEAAAQALCTAMALPIEIEGRPILVEGSVGSAVARADERGTVDLLRNADLALYAAKGAGRGCHRRYDATMEARARARRDLEEDLRGALVRGELEMHVQPIVAAESRRVVSGEALMRWRHPQRGLVPPAAFVPVAEEIGLIEEFGSWMLRRACRHAAGWPGDLRVAVNLSARQFESGTLFARVVTALEASGLHPSRLELEVTENILLKEEHDVSGQLERLRRYGVRIALDDFGTGYASLGYLNSFAVDKIKIDQVFVRGQGRGPKSEAIVEAICSLAERLGLTTVAEGVETEEHLAFVRQAGCREAQGYLFSRPLPVDAFEAFLAETEPPARSPIAA